MPEKTDTLRMEERALAAATHSLSAGRRILFSSSSTLHLFKSRHAFPQKLHFAFQLDRIVGQ
jgi:hypothetical protein